MPRKLGSKQQAALRQIVQNGTGLRAVVDKARTSAGEKGNIATELQRLKARGDARATTVLDLMRSAGAGTGGGSGSSGG